MNSPADNAIRIIIFLLTIFLAFFISFLLRVKIPKRGNRLFVSMVIAYPLAHLLFGVIFLGIDRLSYEAAATPTAYVTRVITITPTKKPYRTLTPTPKPVSVFPDYFFMPGAVLFERTSTVTDNVKHHARNLAIPEPYTWEWCALPNDTSTTDFVNYYRKTMTDRGYKIVFDMEAPNGIYLLKFKDGQEMLAMQFWPAHDDISPMVLIFQW